MTTISKITTHAHTHTHPFPINLHQPTSLYGRNKLFLHLLVLILTNISKNQLQYHPKPLTTTIILSTRHSIANTKFFLVLFYVDVLTPSNLLSYPQILHVKLSNALLRVMLVFRDLASYLLNRNLHRTPKDLNQW